MSPLIDARTARVFLAVGLLLIALVLGYVVVWFYRRRLHKPDEPTGEDLLEQLREAVETGEMAEEEYVRVSEVVRLRGTLGVPEPVPGGNRESFGSRFLRKANDSSSPDTGPIDPSPDATPPGAAPE